MRFLCLNPRFMAPISGSVGRGGAYQGRPDRSAGLGGLPSPQGLKQSPTAPLLRNFGYKDYLLWQRYGVKIPS